MLRKKSSLDTTLIRLDAVNINCFVEVDTRDGYEHRRVFGYRLDRQGSLSAIIADPEQEANGFLYLLIAKAPGLVRVEDGGSQ